MANRGSITSVTVFCGASSGARDAYADGAAELGSELACRDLGIVYGGAHTGLMGALADAALRAGGQVIGVMPRSLVSYEVAHRALTELHIVEDMHERKALMSRLGDAFIALPGGFGTAEELFEIITWSQLGLIDKPIGLLNIAGFFEPLLAWLRGAVAEGFIHARHLEQIIVSGDARDLLDALPRHQTVLNLFDGPRALKA